MKHVLIVGRPGVGKTTLLERVASGLRRCAIDGFLTEELREGGHRLGFWLSCLDGRQALLAHRTSAVGPRIGPYRVNVGVLDQMAVGIIRRAMKSSLLLFIDEIGRMELASAAFETALRDVFEHGPSVIATASIAPLPIVAALKQRRDVELIPLTQSNRIAVEEELSARLAAVCAEDETVRRLQQQADRICTMIVSGDSPPIDIEIQQEALRQAVVGAFPEKAELYQLIYESRFRRLWQQFRVDEARD